MFGADLGRRARPDLSREPSGTRDHPARRRRWGGRKADDRVRSSLRHSVVPGLEPSLLMRSGIPVALERDQSAPIDRHPSTPSKIEKPAPRVKEQQRYDEAPEVEFAPVAERVAPVRAALRLTVSVQHHAASDVDDRVNAFGRHRRAPGEERRREPDRRHEDVGDQFDPYEKRGLSPSARQARQPELPCEAAAGPLVPLEMQRGRLGFWPARSVSSEIGDGAEQPRRCRIKRWKPTEETPYGESV